jgi:hypothetical protein
LITELELLKKRLKSLRVNIENEDFVMQLINNFSMEYDSQVEAIEEDMNKGIEEQVTVKRVRKRIRSRLRRMTVRMDEGHSSNKSDVALVIQPKQFNVLCALCGKQGHKRADCWESKDNRKFIKNDNGGSRNHKKYNGPSKNFKITSKNSQNYFCNYCKEKGRTEPYCYKKQKKKSQSRQGNYLVLMTKNCITDLAAPYEKVYGLQTQVQLYMLPTL